MRLSSTLVAVFLVSCAPTIAIPITRSLAEGPLVAALNYADDVTAVRSPTEDAPFRTSAPAVEIDPAMPRVSVESFALDNGLRGFVVQRRGFPMIAARLTIDSRVLEVGDVGGRRASLLSGVFLSPPEGLLETVAGCGTAWCSVASRGISPQLGDVLDRIANLATRDDKPDTFYTQRLHNLVPVELQSARDPARSFRRIAATLLFGKHHRYGQRAPGDPPTFDELRALRRRIFDPKQASLFVVGDVSLDEVVAQATRRFGAWQGGSRPAEAAPDPPELVSGPMIAIFNVPPMVQIMGAIVARGPTPSDSDFVAFQILAELLGGTPASEAFQHVREEMTAAYNVASWIDWYPDVSVLGLSGSFEREKAIDGMARLIESVRAAREDGPTTEALEGAKRALVARWRQAMATDEGIAGILGTSVLNGIPVPETLDLPARIHKVHAADVQAAAQRFLGASALRVVLVGDTKFMVKAQGLHLGTPMRVDGFGGPL